MFHYSNAGYSLVAAILELVTGASYESFLHEYLLEPVGMGKTGYRMPTWTESEVAHGFQAGRDWGTIVERPWDQDGPYWALRGNGGIHSTAEDMFRWHLALLDDSVLDAGRRKRLVAPYVREVDHYDVEDLAEFHYGYGWSTRWTDRGTRMVRHDGGDGIFLATYRRFVDEGVVIYLVSNVAERPCNDLIAPVEAAVFGLRLRGAGGRCSAAHTRRP
jgi:CubicO group peptidase (beta-lactamase class C family)